MRYVISDLHLNDGGKSDDFKGGEKALLFFLGKVPGRSLILNGDIFDLWESPLSKIEAAYHSLIKILFEKAEYYVLGNHDRMLLGRKDYLGIPIIKHLILGDTLVMHGDDFDIVNSDGHVLGSATTKMVSWLERNVHPDADRWAEKFERWVRKQGRFGTPRIYRDKALQYITQFAVDGNDLKRIVLGHTHQYDQAKHGGLEYLNCGTWIHGKTDRIEI